MDPGNGANEVGKESKESSNFSMYAPSSVTPLVDTRATDPSSTTPITSAVGQVGVSWTGTPTGASGTLPTGILSASTTTPTETAMNRITIAPIEPSSSFSNNQLETSPATSTVVESTSLTKGEGQAEAVAKNSSPIPPVTLTSSSHFSKSTSTNNNTNEHLMKVDNTNTSLKPEALNTNHSLPTNGELNGNTSLKPIHDKPIPNSNPGVANWAANKLTPAEKASMAAKKFLTNHNAVNPPSFTTNPLTNLHPKADSPPRSNVSPKTTTGKPSELHSHLNSSITNNAPKTHPPNPNQSSYMNIGVSNTTLPRPGIPHNAPKPIHELRNTVKNTPGVVRNHETSTPPNQTLLHNPPSSLRGPMPPAPPSSNNMAGMVPSNTFGAKPNNMMAPQPTSSAGAVNVSNQPTSQGQQQNSSAVGGAEEESRGLRELKVEDALHYLDQVKIEFGDRPRIYNEFLEIMKNFKAREIDTPGVIRRVSELFRGYNNLILGFNTFLPEGFKIELRDLMEGGALSGTVSSDVGSNSSSGPHIVQVTQQTMGRGSIPNTNMFPTQQSLGRGQQPQPSLPKSSAIPSVGTGRGISAAPVQPQISSAARPTQQGMTHMQPSIQGRHAPPMFGVPPSHVEAKVAGTIHPQNLQQQSKQAQSSIPNSVLQRNSTGVTPSHVHATAAPPQSMNIQQQQPPVQPTAHTQSQQHQAVEFDHAISYVTTIKRRFENEPRTYQQFLEILHTYQKEQRGIREVLEQVSSLFADHPDLLKQFTYFLPEAVQEQAKARLHRAAADAEARQAAAAASAAANAAQASGIVVHFGSYPGTQSGLNPQIHDKSSSTVYSTPGVVGSMQVQSNVTVKESSQKVLDNAPKQLSVSPPSQRKRPHSPTKELNSLQETSSLTISHFIAQPESYQYNACVERQFFDAAKEALSMYSRDEAWPSFLKIIDMYGQQTITRSEMLETVEELFGKRNELFDQFKKIVTAAGSPDGPSHDGAWHSVPLSEIDFSRCRKCTPSYRALPRDYPTPPCSERSDEERKVLNDVWVSLPVGSEESYTFRHMRKNQHEEILFRCEDERFEIDMVIDSNASTLRRLEPIAEEIALLQQREIVTSSNGSKSLSKGGVSGKVFQYSFDGKVLNTIHRHSISRIYGDSGPEILKLILKNPVVAVPVVVSRLRQKDKEFRAARETLNLRWKELAEHNYFKSLDHRSLNWRNIDKRATSTKTLVAEIKDRESAILARKEKAKEEHGSFYEITMGRFLSRKTDFKECPKPTVELFTSHLSFILENVSWAQRDAFRIMSFALERGIVSPSDKEICHRLLRDFLAPFLGLSLNMIMSPAVSYVASTTLSPSVVTHSEDSGIDDDESSTEDLDIVGNNMTVTEERDRKKTETTSDACISDCLLDHQPIPRGSNVLTIYGEANLIEYRRLDQIYVVSLPYGAVGYLHPKAILCSIMGPTGISSDAVEQYNNSDEEGIEDSLFIGPQSVYVFFRLYDVLVRRLNTARRLADEVSGNSTYQSLVEKLSSDKSPDSGRVRYETYLSLVYDLVEGGSSSSSSGISTNDLEGGKYEDRVRSLLGHGAYELATMDKLMSSLQKNLQNMANDDTVQAMIQVFRIQHDSGSFKPLAFKQEASIASKGDNKGEHKNMFAFQYCKVPGADKSVFHMEFLGDITDHDESSQNGDEYNDVEMGDLNERVEGPTAKRPKR